MPVESQPIRLLAISGSLRKESSNTTLLQAAQALAPEGVRITLYGRLGDLPHFNPDIEFDRLEPVTDLKTQVDMSDGLIISSPEYAHGVPGSLKNALDWLVGGHEFYEKPIAFFHASSRGIHAQASLREIVKTMSGKIIDEASMTLPRSSKHLHIAEIQNDPELSACIQLAIFTFVDVLKNQ